MGATRAPAKGVEVCNTLEVRGQDLIVNVNKRDKWSTYTPTLTIPLDRVSGAEADPEIERKMWRGWAFGRPGFWRSRIFGDDGAHSAPDPKVRFYNPRHSLFVEAERRSLERLAEGARAGHGRDRAAW